MLRVFPYILLLITAACGGAAAPTVTPAPPTVTLTAPQNGTIVYAETLQIAGEAANNPPPFMVQVVDVDENVIVETLVTPEGETWGVEIAHGYNGDPVEAVVRAMTADGTVYDRATILLSNINERPEGVFGRITTPDDGDQVGGDLLPVTGRASGVESIMVELVGSDDTVLDSQTILLPNPYLIDEIPWSADLNRGSYTGQATIRATAEAQVLGEVIVTVIEAAG